MRIRCYHHVGGRFGVQVTLKVMGCFVLNEVNPEKGVDWLEMPCIDGEVPTKLAHEGFLLRVGTRGRSE